MFESLKEVKRKIIVDTDIGPDCDDAGALSVLFTLQKQYGFEVAGIMHCCSNPYGAAAADAIATFFGRDIPIGTYDKPGFLTEDYCLKYNKFLSERYPRSHKDYPSAVTLYRKLLSEAEDKSVVVCPIGPLNNLSELIDSQPDEYSHLTGLELFERKVYSVVAMAGNFTRPEVSEREFNIICDAPAAENFFSRISVPVYLDGFELGINIYTGYANAECDNPVASAYRLFRPSECVNCSFDLIAIHFAVYGEGEYYSLSEPGVLEIDSKGDGGCRFIPREDGNFYKIAFCKTDEEMTDTLNALLTKENI